MKNDKLQSKIIAFVMRCLGWNYNKEQIIGFTMLNYNIFYNEAKERVENALLGIKRVGSKRIYLTKKSKV